MPATACQPFRQGLSARGLAWAVGISGRQKVYPAEVVLTWPDPGRGRPRKNPLPDPLSDRPKPCWPRPTGRS